MIAPTRTRIAIASLTLILSACASQIGSQSNKITASIPDFRSASIFEPNSTVNNLHIRLVSRMIIRDPNGENHYYLLKDHPRESTFNRLIPPYKNIVQEDGASFITFIYGKDDSSKTIHRRYAKITNENKKYAHECRTEKLQFVERFRPLGRFDHPRVDQDKLYDSASKSNTLIGVFEYDAGEKVIRIDFPVALINFNPDRHDNRTSKEEYFQVVSDQVPIYLPEVEGECNHIFSGYISFRSFDKPAQAVYLCKHEDAGKLQFDYGCIADLKGTLSIIAPK